MSKRSVTRKKILASHRIEISHIKQEVKDLKELELSLLEDQLATAKYFLARSQSIIEYEVFERAFRGINDILFDTNRKITDPNHPPLTFSAKKALKDAKLDFLDKILFRSKTSSLYHERNIIAEARKSLTSDQWKMAEFLQHIRYNKIDRKKRNVNQHPRPTITEAKEVLKNMATNLSSDEMDTFQKITRFIETNPKRLKTKGVQDDDLYLFGGEKEESEDIEDRRFWLNKIESLKKIQRNQVSKTVLLHDRDDSDKEILLVKRQKC